jgi:hypothetical protein
MHHSRTIEEGIAKMAAELEATGTIAAGREQQLAGASAS